MTNVTFITKSTSKLQEFERILGFSIAYRYFELPEIQAVEIERVIYEKALSAYRLNDNQPVMVEDTGLFSKAWNGLPGALIKWFLERGNPSEICRMLAAFEDRSAIAKTSIVVCDGEAHTFSGVIEGRIALEPRGDNGFGWDSIFIPYGDYRTFAEMNNAEKDHYSMRRLAIEQLLKSGILKQES